MKESNKKKIAAKELDRKFDANQDVTQYMDFKKAIVVKRINLDIPKWLLDVLDNEALKLNVSRQAIIKMWLFEKVKTLKAAA
jgi:hypothetical protein